MIVSHEHRFIFLKTIKTAGTSAEIVLSQLCGPNDIITPFREDNERLRSGVGPQNYRVDHPLRPKRRLWRRLLLRPERYYHPSVGFYEHMPASEVRAFLGEDIWRSYFKFAFDRNPWDRQISWYFYKTKSKRFPPSFDRFMNRRARAYVWNYEIYSDGSAPAVDFLGQYERLEQDLNKVLRHVGIKEQIDIPRTNITGTRPDRHDYRDFYTPRTRALVAGWYAREIALLGYWF